MSVLSLPFPFPALRLLLVTSCFFAMNVDFCRWSCSVLDLDFFAEGDEANHEAGKSDVCLCVKLVVSSSKAFLSVQ